VLEVAPPAAVVLALATPVLGVVFPAAGTVEFVVPPAAEVVPPAIEATFEPVGGAAELIPLESVLDEVVELLVPPKFPLEEALVEPVLVLVPIEEIELPVVNALALLAAEELEGRTVIVTDRVAPY
jgi:hypothetical protein